MKTTVGYPHITEKAMTNASRGWYTFKARSEATKYDIAKEVEALYKVNVIDVRTIAMHGKMRRAGKKQQAQPQPNWKKALVRLKAGQTIAAFETTGQEKA